MARPKKEKDTSRIYVLPPLRCTKAERVTIQERAASLKMTQSAYMREMGLKGKIVVPQSKVDFDLIHALNRIGVNINQMTKTLHSAPEVTVPDGLEPTLESLNTILDKLMREACSW